MDAVRTHELVTGLTLTFFQKHLLGKDVEFPPPVVRNAPEIAFTAY
jgi:hypothetical protein